MLDGIDTGTGRPDRVPAVGGDRHAEPVRLVAGKLQEVHREELVDLQNLAAEIFFALDRAPHLVRVGDDDVVARRARAEGVVPRADAADRAARHPDARSDRKSFLRWIPRRTSSGLVTMMLSRAVREPKASCPVPTPPIARPVIQMRGPRILSSAVPSFCARVHGPS